MRYELARTPFADGRFHLRAGLQGADGATVLHQLDDALAFVVYPAAGERGLVRLDGSWAKEEIGAPAELSGR